MAENIPNPLSGAVPTKKTTGRVQPKKETVRINLPPKPTAAPTIKMPTLPPGGPSGGSAPLSISSAAPAAPAPAAALAVPRAASAPVAQRQASQTQTQPRSSAPASPRAAVLGPLDTGLAIAAGAVGLIAVGSVVYVAFFILQ